MWTFVAFLAVMLFTVYENRGRLSSFSLSSAQSNPVGITFKLGEETKALIQARVKADKTIVGISVMSADLRTNESKTVHFFGDDSAVVEADRLAELSGKNTIPMFTSDEGHNASTINLINGRFSCLKIEDTITIRLKPELKGVVKTLCKSSIPSYYGYFSGYVAVILNTTLLPEQEEQLRILIDKIATDIYFRDVLSTQYKAGEGNHK